MTTNLLSMSNEHVLHFPNVTTTVSTEVRTQDVHKASESNPGSHPI